MKGVRFESLREVGDPVELAERYSDLGADELVFLDVTATIEGRRPLLELVERAAERLTVPFTVGGGVTGTEDARSLLRAGADKVAVNRAAVDDSGLLGELADEFGSQAVVCAIDARDGEVVTHGGSRPRGIDAVGWAREACERGAGELLLTSIDADGTRGLRPRADRRGGSCGLGAGDRLGRRGRRHAPRRGVRGRCGRRARRVDRPRAAGTAHRAEGRAAGGGMERPG